MDYTQITDSLYIGTTPALKDYASLQELGVRLVINMRFEHPPRRERRLSPIPVLWIPSVDSPLVPIPMRSLWRGVEAALETMQKGGRVYVHCASGRHRGVALGAAILIAQGYSSAEAMRMIKERRPEADPYAWYIRRRIERFANSRDHNQ